MVAADWPIRSRRSCIGIVQSTVEASDTNPLRLTTASTERGTSRGRAQ